MDPVGILEVRGAGTTRHYALDGRPLSLGRAPDNDVILDDASVSRHHTRIEWVESLPHITDLGSANGTIINGEGLIPDVPQRLVPGDSILIVDFQATLSEPAAGAPGRRDISDQPLPADKPALLTHADPAAVTLSINTQRRAQVYPVETKTATIGRDPASDICIDEPVVSWHHARLEQVTTGYQIIDLDSSNGLTCQGAQVAQLLLADGDVLWIADDVCMTYRISPSVPDLPAGKEALPKPIARTPVLVEDAPAPAAREEIQVKAAPLYATMIGSETPRSGLHRIDLQQRTELTIGRSPENDLQLAYPTISRFHAEIRRVGKGEEYTIEDLRSSNGTLVNDQVIEPGKQHTLNPGSTLRIGPIKLIFAPEAMHLVDESRDLRLDALHLNQFVGKGINLLQDISLSILPREFVAVVGVSGAGKSTLLNALAGIWPASDGAVMVNETDLYRSFDAFRTDLGYVPQDDIIHKELTTEKALHYAARLRLPGDTSKVERKQAIVEELEVLGLADRADVPVGSLSGGQRKRVSIGVERLTRPGLFFLDEATSGLDPGTENRLMQLLRQLADDGQTILLITHATKNVVLCDQVAFLAKGGRLAYFGPPEEALAYFGVAEFDEIYDKLENERSPEEWAASYRQSPQYSQYVVRRLRDTYGELLDTHPQPSAARTGRAARRSGSAASRTKLKRPSALSQFAVLSARYLDIIRSDRAFLLIMLLLAPVLGAMDLIAWSRNIFDPVEGNASHVMTMLFLASVIPFLVGALSSVREIVKEKAIYQRERTVNLRIIPYLLSKVGVGLLFALYHAAALLILKLVAVDFSHLGPEDLGLYYLLLLLAVMSGVMWGLLISSLAPREEQAILVAIVLVVIQLVFSGGILSLSELGGVGESIGYVTSTKWAFEAMVDVTRVERGDCDGPGLENCNMPGVQAYDTDPERQVVIAQLESRFGDVFEGDAVASIVAQLAIMLGLFILLAVIQKRKDVI
jgi:ABC-type multidrug transport system ATPase subunit/pSer/pThr/pTyr-binding forkhead associated (FHA) protein